MSNKWRGNKQKQPQDRIPSNMRPLRIAVGIPAYWTVPADFVVHATELIGTIRADVQIICVNMPYIDFARNEIVKRAAAKDADAILFLDNDLAVPLDLLQRLVAHNVPVVSALYFQKCPPYLPLLYDWQSPEKIDIEPRLDYGNGLVQCGAVGMGATLVTMDAIGKVLEWQIKNGEQRPAPFRVNAPIGEDIWFCAHARAAGVPVYCDTSIKIPHVGLLPVTETHHKLARRWGSLEGALARLEELEGVRV